MVFKNFRLKSLAGVLLLLEITFAIVLFSFFGSFVTGGVGGNVTVVTQLQVGNVFPEVLNVSIDDDSSSVTLIANSTKLVSCVSLLRDYNNESDFRDVTAEFFGETSSFYGDSDDNNYHYINTSCNLDLDFGSWNGVSDDDYLALANCSFFLQYYSNPETWNCTVFVNDSYGWNDTNSDEVTVDSLLALGLPEFINYGIVNSTYVSNENITNVTNYGNVEINLSLSGYAVTEGDGFAMNCTLGNIQNISIDYEKYNLTSSTSGDLTLTQFEGLYVNLTSSPVVKEFNLISRTDDLINDAFDSTYWRIYVPKGVAGTCTGNIVFGAVQAEGS